MTRGVLDLYADASSLPPLVARAVEASRRAGVDQACAPEVGRLLHVLAAIPESGRLAELGTAGGVGAAWLAGGMRRGTALLTVELDPARAEVAAAALAGAPGVRCVAGDWSLAATEGPYDLLFSDGGPKRAPEAPEQLAALLRPGGMLLLDDFTPGHSLADDPVRRLWLTTPLFDTVELTLSPAMAVLLAVRR